MSAQSHESNGGKAHASNAFYVKIFAALFVITAVEITVLYLHLPQAASVATLGVLAVAKFAMVVMFFMHLFFDGRLMTFLFVAGLLMAVMTIATMKALFTVPSLTPQAEAHAVARRPPDPSKGPALFVKTTCFTCHTVQSIPEARGKVGPDLDGLATRAGSRKPGMEADAYIRESIENPGAVVVPGFANVMPPTIRQQMSDQDFEDLVAWLKTLK